MAATAILDIDGTLVDTNYQHTIAWARAFARHDIVLPLWRIHTHMGMGGDKLIEAVAGEDVEQRLGDALRDAEQECYGELIGEVRPLEGARDFVERLAGSGWLVVLASSAKEAEVEHYIDLLDARELAHAWTTSADVESTKPEPDLVKSALERGGDGPAVMLGDTPWDIEAAARAGVETVAVLTGGFSERELRDAGAAAVYGSLPELLGDLQATPFAGSE
ncbi:MAG: HAD family hydrolase [Solirubrobacteraceae bacterium]